MKRDKAYILCIEQNKLMNTIFINSENSKTSDLHKLLLSLTDK